MARNIVLDSSRGIAIIAVAVFHMTRGMESAGKLDASPALLFADTLAYGFHVQIFFLISGYFLYRRVTQWADFLPRAINLYYPYLLWSLISMAIILAMPGAVNVSRDWSEMLLIPIIPVQHYWFLAYLIIAIAIMLAAKRSIELATGVLLLISVATPRIFGEMGGPYPPDDVAYWSAFLLTGAMFAKYAIEPKPNWALFVGALLFALGSVLVSLTFEIDIRDGVFFLFSLTACYALICVSAWLGGPILAKIGELSLVIYLTHVIFGSGARIVAYKLIPQAPTAAVLLLSIVAAIAGPLTLYWAGRRTRLNRPLGFDSWPIGRAGVKIGR